MATRIWMFGIALGIVGALVGAPALARERTFTAGPMVGARLFEDDLDLGSEISFGGRLGMNFDDRWGVVFDFLAAHPIRETTQREVVIDVLRALARANILTGRARPYIVAGIGGGMFLFNDAPDSAHGIMTVGAGFEYRTASRILVTAEGSLDAFRAGEVVYAPTGQGFEVEPVSTHTMGNVGLGVIVEF